MRSWIRRLRGAVGTGITWAVAWAAAGVAIGLTTFLPWHPFAPFLRVMDAPLPALGLPGFFAGVFFSVVLGVAARKRSLKNLSLGKFVLWGAVGGALLVLFPFALVAVGLASTSGSSDPAWSAMAAVAPVFVALSSASAAGSLLLARRAGREVDVDAIDDGTLETRQLSEGDPGFGVSPRPWERHSNRRS